MTEDEREKLVRELHQGVQDALTKVSEAWHGEEDILYWSAVFRVFMHPVAIALREDGLTQEMFVDLALTVFEEPAASEPNTLLNASFTNGGAGI